MAKVDVIVNTLNTIHTDIYHERLKLLEIQQQYQTTLQSIKDWEMQVMTDIAADKENSNEQKRKAALQIAKDSSVYYNTLNSRFAETETMLKKQEIQIYMLVDKQNNFRAICNYGKF